MTAPLTIAQALACQQQLQGRSESPGLDVALLLCHCLERPRSYLYAWPERLLNDLQQQQFRMLLARRCRGEPIAHILGYREFWSLPLKVSAASLIPRPDTECLVEQALVLAARRPPAELLDLGTGSGAIALALASELPDCAVWGVDKLPEVVALAEENGRALGLGNVRFLQSDWFAALPQGSRFDMIVANPPYIDANDQHLQQGDLRFEPRSALVAADGGLADLRDIIVAAPRYLVPSGVLLLEHGYQQAPAVRGLLVNQGYRQVVSGRDYGGQERISWGTWQGE